MKNKSQVLGFSEIPREACIIEPAERWMAWGVYGVSTIAFEWDCSRIGVAATAHRRELCDGDFLERVNNSMREIQ